MRLPMKETAAIFVANGQGLIEVKMPSHNADKAAKKNSGISLLQDMH
jgi:hypothetical protein